MAECLHKKTKCLNHYDIFRKYLCKDCNKVFICECEKEIVLKLFPHQSKTGTEYGTQEEYNVEGFSKVCAKCLGEKERPYPRAQIYGLKKKLDRYYWREIDFSYYQKILAYVRDNNIQIKDIFEFQKQFPELCKKFKKEAREYWKKIHKTDPLYQYSEISQDEFLAKVKVPIVQLSGKYINKNGKGLWINKDGNEVSCEEFIADYYRNKGYNVYFCERKIISTLIGAFLWNPINRPDEKLEIRGIGSRGKYSKTPLSDFDKHGILWFHLPKDFGSKEFFIRKKEEFIEWLNLLKNSGPLIEQYDYFLNISKRLRDYLWSNNKEAEEITRVFLTVVPDEITFKVIKWAMKYVWDKQPGWPDLFVVRDNEYFFVEVKGPNDKLSPDQMEWFKWVINNNIFSCYISRLKKS